MKQEHKYAQILRWIADGEEVQWRSDVSDVSTCVNLSEGEALEQIANAVFSPERYRLKPKTIRIGEYDVPEPLRVKPEMCCTYWITSLHMSGSCVWNDDASDNRFFDAGLCHATQEAAELHHKALLSFTEMKNESD